MNEAHLQFLASPEWARTIETELLPWVLDVADLGDDVLEIGPGPGLTTDALRQHVAYEMSRIQSAVEPLLVEPPRRRIIRGQTSPNGGNHVGAH